MIRNNVTLYLSDNLQFFYIWFRCAKAFVNGKRHIPCQIAYDTSQDRKDVVYAIVIFILQKTRVLVAQLNLEQSHEVKDYGNNNDLR